MRKIDFSRPFSKILTQLNACDDGKAYAAQFRTAHQAWNGCEEISFLFWALSAVQYDDIPSLLKTGVSLVVNTPLPGGRTTRDMIIAPAYREFIDVAGKPNVPADTVFAAAKYALAAVPLLPLDDNYFAQSMHYLYSAIHTLAKNVCASPPIPACISSISDSMLSCAHRLAMWMNYSTFELSALNDATARHQIDLVRAALGNPFFVKPKSVATT